MSQARGRVSRAEAGRQRRLRWFESGAQALHAVVGNAGGLLRRGIAWYACPICLHAFPTQSLSVGVLTDEHVPARSIGGRPLVLTCKPCNTRAGAILDIHAEVREAVIDFATGATGGRSLRAVVDYGTIKQTSNVRRDGDTWTVLGVPKADPPGTPEAVGEAFDAWRAAHDGNPTFNLTLAETYSRQKAQLSVVRAAYLALFAALGYRYVFGSAFHALRDQFTATDPAPPIAPVLIDPAGDKDRRTILIVDQPTDLASLAVCLGRYAVLLPRSSGDDSFFTRARETMSTLDGRIRLTGREHPFPRRPMHLSDI